MNPLRLLIFLTFALAVMPATRVLADGTGVAVCELFLTIQGFESSTGVAKLALINSRENFSQETPYKGYDFEIIDKRVVQRLLLPLGEYAIKVFHDENKNGKLDRLVFGIPAEAYGFSNDARASMGPPDYDAAAFKIDTAKKEMIINIK